MVSSKVNRPRRQSVVPGRPLTGYQYFFKSQFSGKQQRPSLQRLAKNRGRYWTEYVAERWRQLSPEVRNVIITRYFCTSFISRNRNMNWRQHSSIIDCFATIRFAFSFY